MKPLLLILLLCAVAVKAAEVVLIWDYDDELSTNLTFVVHWTDSITNAATNWQSFNVVGTATTTRVTMAPAKRFFYVVASNYWGFSDPSNTNWVPKPPTNTANLKIAKP